MISTQQEKKQIDYDESPHQIYLQCTVKKNQKLNSNITASEKNYADVILNFIEKDKKYFAYRLYRDSCIYLHPCFYIKDLDIIANIKKENLLIVDNSLFSFGNNLNNGILISSFYNDKDDTMLCNLAHYLSHLSNVDDVRTANKETFNFEHYLSMIKEEK